MQTATGEVLYETVACSKIQLVLLVLEGKYSCRKSLPGRNTALAESQAQIIYQIIYLRCITGAVV